MTASAENSSEEQPTEEESAKRQKAIPRAMSRWLDRLGPAFMVLVVIILATKTVLAVVHHKPGDVPIFVWAAITGLVAAVASEMWIWLRRRRGRHER